MKLKVFYFLCSLSFLLFPKLSIAQDRCSDLFKDSQSTHKIVQNKRGGKKKIFPSYQEDLKTAQSAGITTYKKYKARYKELGLPSDPRITYKGEWQNWGHFLGTEFPSYQEALQRTQDAGIKTYEEYKAQSKKLGLPSTPHQTYKKEWQSWGHFLGTKDRRGGKKKDFQSFQETQQIAQSAGITTQKEYQTQYKKLGLPSNPHQTYKEEWQSWGHFLGTKDRRGRKKKNFPSYQKAQKTVQSIGIKTHKEYQAQYKKLGLPSDPRIIYKKEWQGWRHFLGTKLPSFQEALNTAQSAGIKSAREYQAQYKKLGLPSNPDKFYKGEWQSWGHFLGTKDRRGRKKKNFPSFQKALQRTQDAGIKTKEEYQAQYRKLGLPSNPDKFYQGEWQSWGHFLGTEQVKARKKKDLPSSQEPQNITQSTGPISLKEDPRGWGNLMGKTKDMGYQSAYPSFQEARQIVQSAGVKTKEEYQAQYKKLGLPSNPEKHYLLDWENWKHFLGTKN